METKTYHSFGRPIEVCTLDNGLTLVCNQIEFAIARVDLVVCVGSYHDPIPGMAHLVEHLISEGPNGDGTHPAFRPLILNGAEKSCTTSHVRTAFSVSCLPDNVASVFSALFAMCDETEFTEERIARERGVVCEEIRSREHQRALSLWEMERLYPNIAGLHAIAGTAESLAEISAESVNRFIRDSYVTDNMLLCVTSPFSLDDLIGMLGNIPAHRLRRGSPVKRGMRFLPRIQDGTFVHPQNRTGIQFYVPEPVDEIDEIRMTLLFEALSVFPFGILYRRLRTQDREVYTIHALHSSSPLAEHRVRITGPEDRFESFADRFQEELAEVRSGSVFSDALALVLGQRRMFFATKPLEALSRAAGWFSIRWLHDDVDDRDRSTIILSTTTEDLVDIANRYLQPDQIGCIRFHRS